MTDLHSSWNKCREILSDNLPPEQFRAWFDPITASSFDGGKLTLRVPSQFFVEQIEERYLFLLSAALKRVFGKDVKLAYTFAVARDKEIVLDDAGKSPRLQGAVTHIDNRPDNPFANTVCDNLDPQLNPGYTFENYCRSRSNMLADSIARAIVDHPDVKTYNPMFVFGPTGTGKTHLINAIGIRFKENNPRMRVLYVTARVFESQYTTAVKQNKVNDFINFYQSIEVLLLDDIQEFAGKTATQNTFFHIFNHLHQHQRQLVMTSDCPPADMDGMVPRLMSRFRWGVTAKLEKPDRELRRAVLCKRAAQNGLSLPDDVVDFIVDTITDNVREIEGVVMSLLAHATMLNSEITISLARDVIANFVKVAQKEITFEYIAETVAKHYDIDPELLFAKTRKREISDARQVLMFFAKNLTTMSSTNIGLHLSRNHATVLHACRQVAERMSVDKEFADDIHSLEMRLKG